MEVVIAGVAMVGLALVGLALAKVRGPRPPLAWVNDRRVVRRARRELRREARS